MKDLDFTGTSTNVPARQGYINLGVYNLDKTNRVDCDFVYAFKASVVN